MTVEQAQQRVEDLLISQGLAAGYVRQLSLALTQLADEVADEALDEHKDNNPHYYQDGSS